MRAETAETASRLQVVWRRQRLALRNTTRSRMWRNGEIVLATCPPDLRVSCQASCSLAAAYERDGTLPTRSQELVHSSDSDGYSRVRINHTLNCVPSCYRTRLARLD